MVAKDEASAAVSRTRLNDPRLMFFSPKRSKPLPGKLVAKIGPAVSGRLF